MIRARWSGRVQAPITRFTCPGTRESQNTLETHNIGVFVNGKSQTYTNQIVRPLPIHQRHTVSSPDRTGWRLGLCLSAVPWRSQTGKPALSVWRHLEKQKAPLIRKHSPAQSPICYRPNETCRAPIGPLDLHCLTQPLPEFFEVGLFLDQIRHASLEGQPLGVRSCFMR